MQNVRVLGAAAADADATGYLVASEASLAPEVIHPALVTTRVKVVTVADTPLVLKAALADNYCYLHSLWGTMDASGTVTVEDSSGTDLAGPMLVGAAGGFVIGPTYERCLCLRTTAVNKGISLLTTKVFNGYAVLSVATAD